MISGIILLNKSPGFTSFEALGEIKRELKTGKVGHTGTLDKFAQGLLIVLAGSSLKLSRWFSGCDKKYKGLINFGTETDTLDPEGKVIAKARIPEREEIEKALEKFKGSIMQAPPLYSAIHINGKRASFLARAGQTPEMKKRPVTVYDLHLLSWEPPFAEVSVHCSSGTYIRSLARDIALEAGSRAHLCRLERTQISGFKLEETGGGLAPVDKTVIKKINLPWFEVSQEETENIFHGKPLDNIFEGKLLFNNNSFSNSAAVFSGETLVAVAEKNANKWKYGCVIN